MSWDQTDLHLHSLHSDGQLSPTELMRFVSGEGIEVAALTDHDTLDGLAEAQRAAESLPLQLIAGIELSSQWQGRSIHVLGYRFNPQSDALGAAIHERQACRQRRLAAIVDRLHRAGVAEADTAPLFELSVPTRTHIAQMLVHKGYANNPQHAFKRWLGSSGVAHVRIEWPEMADTVRSITAAGGLAVIAHPLRYTLSSGQRRQMLREFKIAGGEGLEAVSGGLSPDQLEATRGLALRLELRASRGSDCHDPRLAWHQPSRLAKLHPSLTPLWADR